MEFLLESEVALETWGKSSVIQIIRLLAVKNKSENSGVKQASNQ
jgi:hypothetical protein